MGAHGQKFTQGWTLGLQMGRQAAGVADAINQSKINDMANRFMNTNAMANVVMPPRAEAVNPNAPGVAEANRVYGGPSRPHHFTGGMDQARAFFALRDAMGREEVRALAGRRLDQADKRLAMQEMALNMSSEARHQAEMRRQMLDAMTQERFIQNVSSKASADLRRDAADATALIANMQKIASSASSAVTRSDYDNAIIALNGLRAVANKRGFDVPEFKVPVFQTPEERAALAEQMAEVQDELMRARMEMRRGNQYEGIDALPSWVPFIGRGESYSDKAADAEARMKDLLRRQHGVDPATQPNIPPPRPTSEPAAIPAITTQQEFDALPSGATYRGRDGALYRKP